MLFNTNGVVEMAGCLGQEIHQGPNSDPVSCSEL